jgi:hypothetical protein
MRYFNGRMIFVIATINIYHRLPPINTAINGIHAEKILGSSAFAKIHPANNKINTGKYFGMIKTLNTVPIVIAELTNNGE